MSSDKFQPELLNAQSPPHPVPNRVGAATCILIDAGIETVRFQYLDNYKLLQAGSFPAATACEKLTKLIVSSPDSQVFLTGKLAKVIQAAGGRGESFSPLAVFWTAATAMATDGATAIIDLSASGYSLIGVGGDGQLKDDLLITNPRCGSGPGINLDRILRKLSIEREQVDSVLARFLGEDGRAGRLNIPVRADRCGVFASSATISDKNQGIPIDFALATTLKSEVLKTCKHLQTRFDDVWLTGGVFNWQFARDCAADYFTELGIESIRHDERSELVFQGLRGLRSVSEPERQSFASSPLAAEPGSKLPSFLEVRNNLSRQHLYHRQQTAGIAALDPETMQQEPVLLGIDVGSTMAKIVISVAADQQILYQAAYSNSGDTIDTIKAIFSDLQKQGVAALNVAQLALTGSARYQIQQALAATYPELAERIKVLVENYAHARGSVDLARDYLAELKENGITELNEELCLLVDIGGEDTKISSVDLRRGDLYDNAMNTKCSAGTGSLLDTLVDLFALDSVEVAAQQALTASGAEALNATCAVFLLEHARRLQAEGTGQAEILASAVWAIVENMARSLWPQIYLPPHTLILLHGQTMQSDPLPLAVAQRIQTYLGGPGYCLVPADPGHRACLGLIRTLADEQIAGTVRLPLDVFIEKQFSRKIIQCQGAVCGDSAARCYRSRLTAVDAEGAQFRLGLGGCAAINELPYSRAQNQPKLKNTCRELWQFQSARLPTSEAPDRLVIPRSFAVSEWARFFASLFEPLGIPVHVDAPVEADILRGQPHFRIDTCAPHIGVVGQFLRLAEQPHGVILAPQIEFLPVKGESLGRTCTINQGGFAVAQGLAKNAQPESRIELFYLDLKIAELDLLAHKLYKKLLPVYQLYGQEIPFDRFSKLVQQAMAAQRQFRREAADYAAELAREALAAGGGIALVVGREYILNPGVFDSHIGRLLRDKGLAGIPSHLLDAETDPAFDHLYWRNAHLIVSLAAAVAQRRLHQIVPHPGLSKIFQQYEQSDQLLPLIQVSTFLCGPDSVTSPLISELVKNRPYLRIQSDAAIKELAHLENRMNTYVKQLAASGEQRISFTEKDSFDVQLLDMLVSRQPLNPETDLVCFPTLADNRMLLAVIRSAGYSCLENYTDEYSLQALIEQGRSVAGDSVCAPLAAVYGDVLNAISRFQRLRDSGAEYLDKKRLLIFNNKGLGPCRQGQYVEAHKVFLQQAGSAMGGESNGNDEETIQFLVGHENEGFNTGFPRWVFLRGVQATILQGVLHQLLADGSARCQTAEGYQQFIAAHAELKNELNELIEASSAPTKTALKWCQHTQNLPGVAQVVAFFAYRFHRNYLAKPLRRFQQTWCQEPVADSCIKIHIDGEAYMRTAQFEAIHQALLEILGPGRFHLTYTPLWGFLEYKLAGMLMRSKETIAECRSEIQLGKAPDFIKARRQFLRKKQKQFVGVTWVHLALRKILATPLYRAAGTPMPEPLPKVLAAAKKIISTRRPGGELIPYVGEAAIKLQKGYDLILNIAPEGCMVSSMGEVITPAIYDAFPEAKGKIQPIFSQQGDVDQEKLTQALLQALGPERMYKK